MQDSGDLARLLHNHSKRWIVTLCLVAFDAVILFGQVRPAPPAGKISCAGFLRRGTVVLECSGAWPTRIVKADNITSWAVDTAHLKLGIVHRVNNRVSLDVIDLRTGGIIASQNTEDAASVVATCGTLLLRTRSQSTKAQKVIMTDIESGTNFPLSASLDARCSDDRNVTVLADVNSEWGLRLVLSDSSHRTIATGVNHFDLSPNGKFVAYTDGSRVCGLKIPVAEPALCLEMVWDAGRLSVSNDGEVLLTEATAEVCPFENEALQSSSWPCEAVFSWRIGDKNDQLLAFLATEPQHIGPEVGKEILRMNSRAPLAHTRD
jgi:hypothetical protein